MPSSSSFSSSRCYKSTLRPGSLHPTRPNLLIPIPPSPSPFTNPASSLFSKLLSTMARPGNDTPRGMNKISMGVLMLLSLGLNVILMASLIGLYKAPPHHHNPVQTCPVAAIPQESKVNVVERVLPASDEVKVGAMEASRPEEISVSESSGSRPVTKDSVINLDHGDPTMFESFWKKIGDEATLVIPGWQTMSYFSDAANLCWFLEPDFDREIRRLHKLVGNAVTEDRHIVVGTGSTQLFQAALFALSPSDASHPMSVVSALPYYSSYPAITDFLKSGLFKWAGDARTFQGSTYIEVVCSPNNPDGSLREAVLKSETGKAIHDLAYYWPQYTGIGRAADHEIMLFTVSKSTGHAGTRLGWALVKDKEVARRMVKFVELNTIGVSKDSQLRAAKILKVISDEYEHPNTTTTTRLFDFGRDLMWRRWERVRTVVAQTGGIFSLPEFPSVDCVFFRKKTPTLPAFAWLKCEREDIQDCESFFRENKIITRSGRHFGMSPKFVRISMLDRDETFDLFIERLSTFK